MYADRPAYVERPDCWHWIAVLGFKKWLDARQDKQELGELDPDMSRQPAISSTGGNT